MRRAPRPGSCTRSSCNLNRALHLDRPLTYHGEREKDRQRSRLMTRNSCRPTSSPFGPQGQMSLPNSGIAFKLDLSSFKLVTFRLWKLMTRQRLACDACPFPFVFFIATGSTRESGRKFQHQSFPLCDRRSNSSVRRVVTRVVVKTDDQNTGMVASGSDDQVMQVFEVFRIMCQNREALGNREDEHSRIRQGP